MADEQPQKIIDPRTWSDGRIAREYGCFGVDFDKDDDNCMKVCLVRDRCIMKIAITIPNVERAAGRQLDNGEVMDTAGITNETTVVLGRKLLQFFEKSPKGQIRAKWRKGLATNPIHDPNIGNLPPQATIADHEKRLLEEQEALEKAKAEAEAPVEPERLAEVLAFPGIPTEDEVVEPVHVVHTDEGTEHTPQEDGAEETEMVAAVAPRQPKKKAPPKKKAAPAKKAAAKKKAPAKKAAPKKAAAKKAAPKKKAATKKAPAKKAPAKKKKAVAKKKTAKAADKVSRFERERKKSPKVAALLAGSILEREFDGKVHKVVVMNDHYKYMRRRYETLYSVVQAITGKAEANWSAPKFFKLK